MSTYSIGHSQSEGGGNGWKVFAVFAGFVIPFVIVIGAWLAVSAHNASNQAQQAAASAKAADTSSAASASTSAGTCRARASPASHRRTPMRSR
jgi:hypothetical protein